MSITTETNRTAELTTDGAETEFDFGMLIHATSEVQVWYEVTGGDYVLLTLDTDYNVVFTDLGGTVTTIGVPLATGKLLIIRHIELTQETNWLYNDNHSEQQHQDDFDRSSMRDIQMQEEIDRCIKMSITSGASDDLDDPGADRILFWDNSESTFAFLTASTGLSLTGTNLTTDDSAIDHDALTNTHNLTSDINHDSITNTHNLTTDIDHNGLTNTHNLTSDINHNTILNNHNLTSSIDHDTIANTHNLTTDIDHDALTNFASNEHYLQSAITEVGTIATGTWEGTDIGVAHGGTGASNAAGARTNLGLVIGTDVLAFDTGLQNLAGVAMAADKFYYTSADNVHVAADVTSFARTILDDADEAAFKATVNLEIGVDVLAQQTIGIADDNLLEVDGTANSSEFARFTANGLEGRTIAEMGASGFLLADGTIPLAGAWNLGNQALSNVGDTTFGDGTDVSKTLTFANTGTNHTMTASSALMAFSHTVQAEQLTSTDDITMQGHLFTVGSDDPIDIVFKFLGPFGAFSTLTGNQARLEYSNLFKAPDIHVGSSLIAFGTSQLVGAVTIGAAYNLPAVTGTIGHLVTQTSTGDPDQWGYVNPATLSVALAAEVTVANSTDETSFIAMFDSPTGNLPIRTETGLTYNSATKSLGIGGDLDVAKVANIGDFSDATVLDVRGWARLGTPDTDATEKSGRFVTRHYTNAEEDVSMLAAASSVGNTIISFGGGSAANNAATVLNFYTAMDTTTLFGTNRLTIKSTGSFGFNTTSISASTRYDFLGLGLSVFRFSNVDTDDAVKLVKIVCRHRDNEEEDVMMIYSNSGSSNNDIYIGGGSGAQNAATRLFFRTAANRTTVSGTNRVSIASNGLLSALFGLNVTGITTLGNGTDELQVSATGDLSFAGTGGLLYGNMDQDGGVFTVFLENVDQLYELDADTTNISAGPLNDVTFPGDHFLKVKTAGVYKIDWSLICQISGLTGGSEHVEFEVLKNGNATSKGESHVTHKNTARDFPLGSTTLLDLAVDDEISIGATARDSSGKTITIDHLEMSIFMVGGT